MLITYKTEINPAEEQKTKINQTIGTCRFMHNFYIAENQKAFEDGKPFITAFSFSNWLNNEFIPNNPDYLRIKDVSTKSVTKSMMNAESAFKKFFKGQAKYPKFKKKNKSDVKMYFVKDGKTSCLCERHRIKIPTLGRVRLKEKGYIPTSKDGYVVRSGTVSCKAGRYYVSCLVDIDEPVKQVLEPFGLGIDLGLKEFATVSNGNVYNNINKSKEVIRLEKKLKREQRCLSRKYEHAKKKGDIAGKNIQKQILKIQRIYNKLNNIRTDYINKIVSELVKTNPAYITIEDLNVSGMMKNKHLSKAIANQKFYEFRQKLIFKCKLYGIELRIVDRFYPSSKTCHNCGNVKKDLKLSDRTYKCPECSEVIDRDLNASLNLRDTAFYKVA